VTTKPKQRQKLAANRAKVSPVEIARNVPERTRFALVARAGGRCEFDGCNRFILEHPVTHQPGLFADIGHIVAFKMDGPRGERSTRPENPHVPSNLMLLCKACHRLIDDNPDQYPRALLEQQKAAHEERIRIQTEIGPDRQTAIFVLKAPIGGQHAAITQTEIADAIAPRYTDFRGKTEADLTQLWAQRESPEFLILAKELIDRAVERAFQVGGDAMRLNHVSVFALAPIPLLIYLGYRLTNKVPMDFFQRHRNPENWTWRADGEPVRFVARQRRSGVRGGPVALLLGLSGAIATEDLPEGLRDSGSIYEVSLESRVPAPTFLNQRVDLEAFRTVFQEVMGMIVADHGLIPLIELFPAVPAPIAVLCGRERLPKAHPGFRVHDRIQGRYIYQLEVR